MKPRVTFMSCAFFLLRCIVGAIFIYAGLVKVADYSAFEGALHNYHLLPHRAMVATAHYLPWLEVLCGVCVVLRWFYSEALILLAVMILFFIGAVTSAWWRGIDISCGCFGNNLANSSYLLVLSRDVFIGLAIMVLLRDPHGRVIEASTGDSVGV